MDEPPRIDIRYEGCFSGPPFKPWLGGIVGFLLGVVLGLVAVIVVAGIAASASAVAIFSLWIGCIVVCTVLFTVFCRARPFTVDLRADHLDLVTRRSVRSIPYDWIRFVDGGARIDPEEGERPNVRVRILGADGRTMRIGLNSTAAASLVGALRYRCPRAGGIQLDGTDWLPEEPSTRSEVRRRLRRILLDRAILRLVVGGGLLAMAAALFLILVDPSHRFRNDVDYHEHYQITVALGSLSFSLWTIQRGVLYWKRARELATDP